MSLPSHAPRLLQVLCAFLMAVGIGLLVAGISLHPAAPADGVAQTLTSMSWSPRDVQFFLQLSASLKGVGSGLLALGLLGLIIPLINTLVSPHRVPATE